MLVYPKVERPPSLFLEKAIVIVIPVIEYLRRPTVLETGHLLKRRNAKISTFWNSYAISTQHLKLLIKALCDREEADRLFYGILR